MKGGVHKGLIFVNRALRISPATSKLGSAVIGSPRSDTQAVDSALSQIVVHHTVIRHS